MSSVEVKTEGGLSALCGVCTSPAAAHQHYGAVCCYSCRAFFRRGVGRIYNCVRGDGRCQVNKINRTNCRKCRFDTCLVVGMRPELVDATLKSRLRDPTSPGRIPEQEQRDVAASHQRVGVPPQMFIPEIKRGPDSSVQRLLADSVLLQALEGKRKVVLEPRNPCPTIVPTIATNKLIDLSKIAQSNKVNQLSMMTVNSNQLLDLTNHKTASDNLVTQIQVVDEDSEFLFSEGSGSIYYAPAHLVPFQDQFQFIKEETVLAEDITEQEYQIQEEIYEEPMKEEQGNCEEQVRLTENTYFREEVPVEVAVIRTTPYQRRVHLENKYSTVQKYHSEERKELVSQVQRYIPEFHESFTTKRFITECSRESFFSQRCVPETSTDSFPSQRFITESSKDSFLSQRFITESSTDSFSSQRFITESNKDSFPSQRFITESSKDSFPSQRFITECNKDSFPSQKCILESSKNSFPSQRYAPENSKDYFPSQRLVPESSKDYLPSQRYAPENSKDYFHSQRLVPENSKDSLPSQRFVPESSKNSLALQQHGQESSKDSFSSQRYVPESSKDTFPSRRFIPEYSKEFFPSQKSSPKLTEESSIMTNGDILKETLRCVNIEDLVDSCFEEEFKKESNAEEQMVEPTLNNHTNDCIEENINNKEEEENIRKEIIPSKEETNTKIEHMDTEQCTKPVNVDVIIKPKEKKLKPKTNTAKLLKKRRTSGSPLPIKKRRRNPDMIYPVSLAVSRRHIPIMDFTLEEEFRLYDLMVRREHLHQKEFRACLDIGTPLAMKRCIRDIVENTKVNQKIRFDEQLFDRWLGSVKEVYITHARGTFQEFSKISSSKCTSMFSSTYPAVLACCMAYYFHGGDFNSYIEQEKFVGRWAGETSKWILENIPDIKEVRRVGVDDFSLFTSPWATTTKKEKFFEKSLKTVGELIQEDDKLATIFMLLLMMSPKDGSFPRDEQHQEAQNDIRFLMYRYLKSKPGYDHDKANKTAHSIEGMIKALHKCGNIFINKRLKAIEPSDTFTELM